MIRSIGSIVLSITVLFMLLARAAAADTSDDRAVIAEVFAKLSDYADTMARSAAKSEDRAIRKPFASRAADVADDLSRLAQRSRKDVAFSALASDAGAVARDAAALIELADEADDRHERKNYRAQATALEQGIAAVRKALDALRDTDTKPAPMRDAAFLQLLRSIKQTSFDDDKVEVVRHAAKTNYFLAAQVAAVMEVFSFDDAKVNAAVAMWPRITDPENSFIIFNKLTFDSSKEQLRKRVGK
jgi:hypothetical protein